MTSEAMETILETALHAAVEEGWLDEEGLTDDETLITTRRFREAGLMTDDAGLVITVDDPNGGVAEFQVSIVRSR